MSTSVLKLSASSPEHGLAEEELEVDYNGDGLERADVALTEGGS